MSDTLTQYRAVLKIPGAKSLLALSFATRAINIPLGALLTVVAFEVSGSWVTAAVSGGIVSLSAAISFWLSGKAFDIFNPRAVLLLFLPGSFLPLLFLTTPGVPLIFLIALLVGLGRPPSGTTIRTSWQRVVTRDSDKITAYGLDSATAPIAGSLGSALGALLFVFFSYPGVVALLVVAAFLTTLLLAFHKSTGPIESEPKVSRENLPPLGTIVWLPVLLVALSWGALVGLEILVGDRFGPDALLWFNAVGALLVAVGAFLVGGTRDRTGRQALTRGSVVAAVSLLAIAAGFFIWLPLLFLPVITFAIARGGISASASTFLSIESPESRRSEALALYGSGVLVGQAIFRPLSGAMLVFAPVLILVIPAALFLVFARVLAGRS